MNTIHIPTQSITPEALTALTLVGRIVTYQGQQYKVHSVEGVDFYAFTPADRPNTVTCDFGMTPSQWHSEPTAFILPMGAKIGDGFGIEVEVAQVKRGVCLAKGPSSF